MRGIAAVAVLVLVAAGPALAQSGSASSMGSQQAQASNQKPVDHGPYTPQANGAYQGGGMILQGAPGAPAPRPEATPPGQTPAHMVPPSTQ